MYGGYCWRLPLVRTNRIKTMAVGSVCHTTSHVIRGAPAGMNVLVKSQPNTMPEYNSLQILALVWNASAQPDTLMHSHNSQCRCLLQSKQPLAV